MATHLLYFYFHLKYGREMELQSFFFHSILHCHQKQVCKKVLFIKFIRSKIPSLPKDYYSKNGGGGGPNKLGLTFLASDSMVLRLWVWYVGWEVRSVWNSWGNGNGLEVTLFSSSSLFDVIGGQPIRHWLQ